MILDVLMQAFVDALPKKVRWAIYGVLIALIVGGVIAMFVA